MLGVILLAFEMPVDGSVGLFAGRIGSGTVMIALAGRLALEAR